MKAQKEFQCIEWWPNETIVIVGVTCTKDCSNCDIYKSIMRKYK